MTEDHGGNTCDFFMEKAGIILNRREQSAKRVQQVESIFKCPICDQRVKVVNHSSLICENRHTFDFTKYGYINLLPHPSKSLYDKELFVARQKIIMDAQCYQPLHETIANAIDTYVAEKGDLLKIVDLGCGEGSHLHAILSKLHQQSIGVGLDIAKEGIIQAAKHYSDYIWTVGDIAKSPFENETFQVTLNILSPSNYKEFKRILDPCGIVIKVIPSQYYLQELRDFLYPQDQQKYNNQKIIDLFKEHFTLVEQNRLQYTVRLDNPFLRDLVRMTPLSWSRDQQRIVEYLRQEQADVTFALDVLIGQS